MFIEEQIQNLQRRLKKMEENPRPDLLQCNKLRYEIELENYLHILDAWKDGKPFGVLKMFHQLGPALGLVKQGYIDWGDRVTDPQRYLDIAVNKTEYADILAEVSTERWEDLVLYRYIRSASQIGDLSLREMYARIKELKAGRGFCVGAGGFTETAQQFVEARLIDLVDKKGLVPMLNRLTSWSEE